MNNLILQNFNSCYLYLFSVNMYIIQVSEKYWQHNNIDRTQRRSRIICTTNERVYVCVCLCYCDSRNTDRGIQDTFRMIMGRTVTNKIKIYARGRNKGDELGHGLLISVMRGTSLFYTFNILTPLYVKYEIRTKK